VQLIERMGSKPDREQERQECGDEPGEIDVWGQ
jgi:hypothetical protein